MAPNTSRARPGARKATSSTSISTPSRIRPGPAAASRFSIAAAAYRGSRRSSRAFSRRIEGAQAFIPAARCQNAPAQAEAFYFACQREPTGRANDRFVENSVLEGRLEAVELRDQRIADRGALGGRGVERGIETAQLGLSRHPKA